MASDAIELKSKVEATASALGFWKIAFAVFVGDALAVIFAALIYAGMQKP